MNIHTYFLAPAKKPAAKKESSSEEDSSDEEEEKPKAKAKTGNINIYCF